MNTPPDSGTNRQSEEPSSSAAISTTVAALLAATTPEEQRAQLNASNLFSADGLGALLAYAQAQVGEDPVRSRRLAQICRVFAQELGADESAVQSPNAASLAPLALYFQAQTHAMNGEFEIARGLIEQARGEFQAAGDASGALRTNLGLMNVLGELGRHAEAVDAGNLVLAAVAPQLAGDAVPPQLRGMAAGVHANLGVCFSQMGLFDAALDAYQAAEEQYALMGEAARAATLVNNRGITLLYLGQVRAAIELFEQAIAARHAADLAVLEAQSQANLGEACLLLGDYGRALQALESARQMLLPASAAADLAIVTRKLGDAYLALNLVDEAVEMYTEALELATNLGMAHQQGWIEWGLGAAHGRAGQVEQARAALARAAEFFNGIENRPLLSSVRLEEAAALQLLGEADAAQEVAQAAWHLVADSPWHVQQIYAALRLFDLAEAEEAVQGGGPESAADEWLVQARTLATQLDLPHLTYRVDARAGRRAWQAGDVEAAEALLLAAIENLETVRGTVAQEALRTSFLQDKTAVYSDLLRLYLTRNGPSDAQAAFAVVERSQSRVLVDLLQGLAARAVELEDTERAALDALQADLDALYNRLLEGNSGSDERGSAPAAVAALEQSIRQMRLRAVARHAQPRMPQGARGFRGGVEMLQGPVVVADLTQLQSGLGAGHALVAYFVLDDEIGAFVVDGESLHVVRGLTTVAAVQMGLGRLEVQWERFRMGSAFVEAHLAQLTQSAQRILGQLYGELWKPLEAVLSARVDRITVIPQGVLHQVPFHALYDGGAYLLARHVFTYAPSATVHLLCRTRPEPDLTQAVVVGVDDPQLPFVAVETRQVADLFPRPVSLVGEQATQAQLQAALREQGRAASGGGGLGAIHLACHGLFRADNPVYSALKLADGWLTAVDLLSWSLEGALVVLSACESGRSRVVPGNELLGIPRAVLGAGARNAVVSQWLVQDEAAAQLMTDFYRALRTNETGVSDVPGALCTAQQALATRYPHPYYWAAFMVMGAG